MRKITIIILAFLLVSPLVMAESSLVFQRGTTIDLKIPVTNSDNSIVTSTTNCNITIRDNNDNIMIQESPMTASSSGLYNYSFVNTSSLGEYPIFISCTDGIDNGFTSYSIIITASGEKLNLTKGILYIFFLCLLIFFFIVCIIAAKSTPTEHKVDDFGNILSINNLRHLRPVFLALAWGLLLSIMFTSSNVALIYLGDSMFGDLLFKLSMMLFWLSIPAMIIWVMFIFIGIFKDKENKKLIERGIDIKLP